MDTQNPVTAISNLTSSTAPLNEENAQTLLRIGLAYRPELDATLLGKMANEVLARYTPEQVRATPESILQEVLTCSAAWALGRNIAHEFNLTAHFEEYVDVLDQTEITILRKAAINDLEPPGFVLPGYLAGYRLASPHNAGRSYKAVVYDIEQYLLSSGKAASEKEAILVLHLLASHAHQDLLIKDIPQDLPYGVSVAWVNFKHGVSLAQAKQPGSSSSMTFQALLQLPSSRSAELMTDAEREAFEESRVEPVLIWAMLNGILRQSDTTPYSTEEIRLATHAFENHQQESLAALTALTTEPPDRRAMALQEINRAVTSPAVMAHLRREVEDTGWPTRPLAFHADMRLVPRDYGDVYTHGNFESTHTTVSISYRPFNRYDIQRPSHALVDVYMHGENIDEWRTPGLHQQEGASKLPDAERALYKTLPNLSQLFEQRFSEYLNNAKSGYGFLIKRALASLPLEHRIAIEYGEVAIYSLRTQTSGREAGEENEEDKEPLRGRYGFILQASYDTRINYYEVFPFLSLARHRSDIHQLAIGGVYRTEQWKISKNPAVSVTVRRGTSLPFDWDAYQTGTSPKDNARSTLIAEPVGAELPGPTANLSTTDSIPLTMHSSKTEDIAQRLSTYLFYLDEQLLHEKQRGQTSLDAKDPFITIIKWITPWGHIENLLSGERDRIRTGAFGLFAFIIPYSAPIGKIAAGSIALYRLAAGGITFMMSSHRKAKDKSKQKEMPVIPLKPNTTSGGHTR